MKNTIIDGTLDNYVNEMIQDYTKRKSFWYVDAHNRPYKITDETQKYLESNFSIENNVDLYDTWTKHYVKSSGELSKKDISEFNPIKDKNGDGINFAIEKFESDEETINIVGWAYLENVESQNSNLELLFISNGTAYLLPKQKTKRDDVTTYFKSQKDLSNSGFESKTYLKKVPPGKYQLGIIIKNPNENKKGLVITDKIFEKN